MQPATIQESQHFESLLPVIQSHLSNKFRDEEYVSCALGLAFMLFLSAVRRNRKFTASSLAFYAGKMSYSGRQVVPTSSMDVFARYERAPLDELLIAHHRQSLVMRKALRTQALQTKCLEMTTKMVTAMSRRRRTSTVKSPIRGAVHHHQLLCIRFPITTPAKTTNGLTPRRHGSADTADHDITCTSPPKTSSKKGVPGKGYSNPVRLTGRVGPNGGNRNGKRSNADYKKSAG